MSFVNSYRFATGGGAGPPNACGTGNIAPSGWVYLHNEISGGLGSWGNMLKVENFTTKGATVENVGDGSDDFCYLEGEIDFPALDAFFTADADVECMFDQLGFDDVTDNSGGFGYIKSSNDMNFNGALRKGSGLNVSGIASKSLGDAWTMCYVLDFTSLPVVNKEIEAPIAAANRLQIQWAGNGVSLIVRFRSPNQGYFYNGLRATGTKLLIFTYDGSSPINRSGLNLYWAGSTTPETPDGIYNSGAPTSSPFSDIKFGLPASTGGFFKEFDFFDHAFNATEITAAKDAYEQLYTFS